jgi:hypothetical protein
VPWPGPPRVVPIKTQIVDDSGASTSTSPS